MVEIFLSLAKTIFFELISHNSLTMPINICLIGLGRAEGTDGSRIKYSFPQRYQESYLAELMNFETAIKGDRAPSVTQEECLLSLVVADAAFESAHHGIEIRFRDFYADRVAD